MSRTSVVVDEMVREYLIFRGFTKAAQTLETEIKFDKDKNMRADKITEHLFSFIYGFDLVGLRDYWGYLNKRFFRRIPNSTTHSSVLKLENCLFKYYIVYAHQAQKHDKVSDFFEKLSSELMSTSNKDTWREWFCFPYIRNPELNTAFEPYFSQVWFDTFNMSLQNFVSTVLDAVPLPALLQWSKGDREERAQLRKEINKLRGQLSDETTVTRSDNEDFYIISAGRSPDVTRPDVMKPDVMRPDATHSPFTILSPRDYTGHTAPLTSSQFSCEGMFCCTSDTNGVVKVWAFSPQLKTLHSFVFKSGVYSVHWARKLDKLLYIGTGDSKVKIINISNRKVCNEISHPTPALHVVCIASNLMGTSLVTAAGTDHHCELVVWDSKTLQIIHTLDTGSSPVYSCHFNHNGNLLVSGTGDGMIRAYDMSEYQCIMGWQANSTAILTVRFSIDENTVFCYSADGNITQWRLYPMSQCLYSVSVNKTPVVPQHGPLFALDSEGEYLLAARGEHVVIYRLEGGIVEEGCLPSQGSTVSCVDWHIPYSTRLCLTATVAGVARITELLH